MERFTLPKTHAISITLKDHDTVKICLTSSKRGGGHSSRVSS